MINPKNELFRWGPIDGLPVYPEFWFAGLNSFQRNFAPGWPEVFNYFEGSKFTCIIDKNKLYDAGEVIFTKHVLPEKLLRRNYQAWLKFLVNYLRTIEKIKKTKLTRHNIISLLEAWININGKDFWSIGSLPEVANWGGERLLERELRNSIKPEADFHLAFERLAAPENHSFYQLEELDLLKLKNLNGQKLEQGLARHQQKYYWLLNGYYGTKILPIGYFRDRLRKESVKSAREKIKGMNKHLKDAKEAKEEVVKKYRLPKHVLKVSRALAFSVWWQDIRKAYILQGLHVTDLLLRAIARVYRVKICDLKYYNLNELKELASEGVALSEQEMCLRKSSYFAGWDGQNPYYVSGRMAVDMFASFIDNKISDDITELKGLVVNGGRAIGRVRILHSPREAGKMKKGDILVASMTSPDYIVALKKAAAVVTDVGGMTCHAAIVSRELKIPGIVATKVATKVLHDGDLVEVDANNAIVKIIKKHE